MKFYPDNRGREYKQLVSCTTEPCVWADNLPEPADLSGPHEEISAPSS